MKQLSNELSPPFPYLYDADQSVAKNYHAQCTPDNYLFTNKNGSFELFFHGRFNDNWKDLSNLTERNVEDNIERLLERENPEEIWYPSIGCSIKWKLSTATRDEKGIVSMTEKVNTQRKNTIQ